jgi:UDP-GlcNAc:undecaprenyl-phosphate GlcNAc-1-phosphate transferase
MKFLYKDNIFQIDIMTYIIPYIFSSIALALVGISFLIPFAKNVGAVDTPKHGKVHLKSTPLLGGIAIIIGTLFPFFLTEVGLKRSILFVLIGALCMAALGLYDDLKELSPFNKLLFQGLICISLLYYFYKGELNVSIMFLSWCWLMFIMNSFNNMDGMDGLAAGLGFIFSVFLYFIFPSLLLLSLGFSCLAFLCVNYKPAKQFMGDTGSLFIGWVIASIPLINLISFFNLSNAKALFIILSILIIDTVVIICIRLYKRRNIFKGDLSHSYNLIWDFFKHKKKKRANWFFFISSSSSFSNLFSLFSPSTKTILLMYSFTIFCGVIAIW